MIQFILFILFLFGIAYVVTKINGGEYYENLMVILVFAVLVLIILSLGIFCLNQFNVVLNL